MSLVLKNEILNNYFTVKVTTNSQIPSRISDHLHFRYIDYISLLLLLSGDIETNPGPSLHKDLTISHLNCQSVFNKLDLIALELNKFDVITLSETWLDDSINSSDLLIPNYHPPSRLDRNRHGGGVAVYISKHIPFIDRTDLLVNNLEAVWVEIIFNNKKILIGTFYLHPRFNDWDLVRFSIDQAFLTCPNIILLGDFNENMLEEAKSRNIRYIINMYI